MYLCHFFCNIVINHCVHFFFLCDLFLLIIHCSITYSFQNLEVVVLQNLVGKMRLPLPPTNMMNPVVIHKMHAPVRLSVAMSNLWRIFSKVFFVCVYVEIFLFRMLDFVERINCVDNQLYLSILSTLFIHFKYFQKFLGF